MIFPLWWFIGVHYFSVNLFTNPKMTWLGRQVSTSSRSRLVKFRLYIILYIMSSLGGIILYTFQCRFTSHYICLSITKITLITGLTIRFTTKHLSNWLRSLILYKCWSEDWPSWGIHWYCSCRMKVQEWVIIWQYFWNRSIIGIGSR